MPWSFTIEFDEGRAESAGYDVEELYDCTDRNVSRYGCVRAARGDVDGGGGRRGRVPSAYRCPLLSRADWFMSTVGSITAFEDDTDEIDYLDVLRRYAPHRLPTGR